MLDARGTDEGGRIYYETVEVKHYRLVPGHHGLSTMTSDAIMATDQTMSDRERVTPYAPFALTKDTLSQSLSLA